MAPHPIKCQVSGCVTADLGTPYVRAGLFSHSAHMEDLKIQIKMVRCKVHKQGDFKGFCCTRVAATEKMLRRWSLR